MKKETINKFLISICLILCLMPNALNAQSKKPLNMPLYDDEPYHYGFILGINQMMFTMDFIDNYQSVIHQPNELPYQPDGTDDLFMESPFMVYDIYSEPKYGFTVGVIGNLRLARHFDLRFSPSLSFGEREIRYTIASLQADLDNVVLKQLTSSIQSAFGEFPLHIKYKSKRNYNTAAYILAGVNYKMDMSFKKDIDKNEQLKELNVKRHDIAAEIGAGFDFYTGYFKLGVELKMSYGLLDVAKDKDYMFTSSFDSLRNKGFQISFTFE